MFNIISFVMMSSMVHATVAELRWCKVSNTSSSLFGDGWIQFDDLSHSCVECSSYSVELIEIEKVSEYECCNNWVTPIGNCESRYQDEGTTCSNSIRVSILFVLQSSRIFVSVFINIFYKLCLFSCTKFFELEKLSAIFDISCFLSASLVTLNYNINEK